MANPMVELYEKQDQSPWLDFIRRNMLNDGGLKRYIEEDGIRGVTANPTIFAQAIGAGDDYDAQIADLVRDGVAPHDMFEQIAIDDIRTAADLLRPVYDASGGGDGFVSIEVSPDKAFQTQPTIDEAKRWWSRIGRPNLLIKIPATSEGMPGDRGVHCRRPQHQRHADLRHQLLRARDGGLHPRPRAPRRRRPGPARRALGRQLLREPRRHRHGQASRRKDRPRRRPMRSVPSCSRCSVRPPSRTRRSPTSASSLSSAASDSRSSSPQAPARSARSGPAPAPRTRPTATSSTSRS